MAPIFMSFSCMLERERCATSHGRAKRRRRLPRKHASKNSANLTRLEVNRVQDSLVHVRTSCEDVSWLFKDVVIDLPKNKPKFAVW